MGWGRRFLRFPPEINLNLLGIEAVDLLVAIECSWKELTVLTKSREARG